jgi:hypothetical protein
VLSASNKYKEENDMFMAFFGDCYVKEAGAFSVPYLFRYPLTLRRTFKQS